MTWMLQAIYRRPKSDNLLRNGKNEVQKPFWRSNCLSAPPYRLLPGESEATGGVPTKRREVKALRAS